MNKEFIDNEKALNEQELEAVVGGKQTYYSISEVQKNEYGEFKTFTYYDENKKEVAHLDCPLGKVDGTIERLTKRGLSAL